MISRFVRTGPWTGPLVTRRRDDEGAKNGDLFCRACYYTDAVVTDPSHSDGTTSADETQAYITSVLEQVDAGDHSAVAELLEGAYAELRALAGSFFRDQRANHTLQPTALVHEAFVKLTNGKTMRWENRKHFFIVAGKVMRQVLADHAKGRLREKRGGDWQRVTLTGLAGANEGAELDAVALEAALAELDTLNRRHAQIVELRFLTGLTIDEVADVLGVSSRTVELDWRQARAWLRGRLSRGDGVV